jgi:hypothetical protein
MAKPDVVIAEFPGPGHYELPLVSKCVSARPGERGLLLLLQAEGGLFFHLPVEVPALESMAAFLAVDRLQKAEKQKKARKH